MAGILPGRLSRGGDHQRELGAGGLEGQPYFLGMVFGLGFGNTLFLWAGIAGSPENSGHRRRPQRSVGDWTVHSAIDAAFDGQLDESNHHADNPPELAIAPFSFNRWLAAAGGTL